MNSFFLSKARCPFTQYIPSKPDKFGIKFWLLVDVSSKYLCNGFPYLGREAKPPNQSLAEFVVLRLMEPFYNKGYNLTCDNFFTSFRLVRCLREKKTTLVGTTRRNRKELPDIVRSTSSSALHSTSAFSSDGITLTVYKAKPSASVLIISSRHEFVKTEENGKQKPNTVKFYNHTKFGVDILDEMARKYSVKPASRRWPVHVFCNILDLAAINAWILFREATHAKISRREYLQRLVEEMTEPIRDRRVLPTFSAKITTANERVACRAGHCNNNKTRNLCSGCSIPLCGSCTKDIKRFCSNCADQ